MRTHPRSVPALGIGATALLIALAQSGAASTIARSSAHATPAKPTPASAGHTDARTLVSPLPTSQCVAQLGIHCYSPL